MSVDTKRKEMEEKVVAEFHTTNEAFKEVYEEAIPHFSQTYDVDKDITISGSTFMAIVNGMAALQQRLNEVENARNFAATLEINTGNELRRLSTLVLDQHIKNVESGQTITAQEGRQQDAEKTINLED